MYSSVSIDNSRKCFDKVSSDGTCIFSDYNDSVLHNTENMKSSNMFLMI